MCVKEKQRVLLLSTGRGFPMWKLIFSPYEMKFLNQPEEGHSH